MDKLYAQGVKPSAALRAYDSCKETNLWMQDELYLSGWEIEEISKTLTKHGDEVNTLVEKAASERAARYAYDHPKLPKGFVTIEQLQGDLDLGDLRDEVEDFDFDGDLTVAFGETADYKVDDNYHDLLSWLPDHTEWLEQAEFDGLLEGCKGDIYKMVQMAQYVYFKSDLYDHCEDICRYGTLDQLRDMGVYAIRESTMSLATRTGSSTTSITARNSAPPPVTWSSPSDALLRNTRKRKGRSLTTSPPANGVCILSTPESVTVSMVA